MSSETVAAVVSAALGIVSVVVGQWAAWRWPKGYHRRGASERNSDTPEDANP